MFGPRWDQSADGCNRSLRLPGDMLRMIDEIPVVDRLGGPRRLGALTAVKRLDPEGWYFACHFTGDPVLAGSLIAEGGVQLLQTYAMYLGMHMVFPDAEFQAVPGLETEVKVRGQITPRTREVRYEVEITELTMLPRPTVVADITVYDGDKPIVAMRNFGVRVQEKPGTAYRPEAGGLPAFLGRRNERGEAAFINELHLAHAAKGDLGTAMGTEFEIYAGLARALHPQRRLPVRGPHHATGRHPRRTASRRHHGHRVRLPARGLVLPGHRRAGDAQLRGDGDLPAGGDPARLLPGRHPGQPGRGAVDPQPGRPRPFRAPPRAGLGKTVRHESELLSSQSVPGATLQKFRYRLLADDEVFYEGESLFGYFTEQALSNQVGLDSGTYVPPWLEAERAVASTRPGRGPWPSAPTTAGSGPSPAPDCTWPTTTCGWSTR
ncbi:hypothetical protein LUW77_28335 [Streptomyces radiopugnans]|nr:hypothetical protein LUW77_28335 [Streptomyces radiopugnans]